jgi:hypothetical protein
MSGAIKVSIRKGFLFMFFGLLTIIQTDLFAQADKANTQNVDTPFNMSEIIEKVVHHPLKNGELIVIRDQAYEAFFDERGVILNESVTGSDLEMRV